MSYRDLMVDGHMPKEAWGDGPWQDEPDRVEWHHKGLPCLARRGPHGSWCGYVAVPPGHPLHAIPYSLCPVAGCDESWCDHRPDAFLEVHGGLTYSDFCQADAPEGHGICHVPRRGEPDNVWWFGFDCGHACDLSPATAALLDAIHAEEGTPNPLAQYRSDDVPAYMREVYRDLAYVTAETNTLAGQLAAMGR